VAALVSLEDIELLESNENREDIEAARQAKANGSPPPSPHCP